MVQLLCSILGARLLRRQAGGDTTSTHPLQQQCSIEVEGQTLAKQVRFFSV